MAARGHDVHLFHAEIYGQAALSTDDIPWYEFAPAIRHHFPGLGGADRNAVPEADIIFGYSSEREMPPQAGLPVVLIQGYRMFKTDVEQAAYRAPCPKICVARWLIDVGVSLGVPREQFAYVPNGIHQERFPLKQPIEARRRRVALCYNEHPTKGWPVAVDVFRRMHDEAPDVELVVFSTFPAPPDLPPFVDYRRNPPLDEIVDDIYNQSAVFLCTSEVEGFGLTSIEAMACGAALVTTDNGGSHDYAFDGETALVSPHDDPGALVANLRALLDDDARRMEIAQAGRAHVAIFNWAHSAAMLEEFLDAYRADPAKYGRPVSG